MLKSSLLILFLLNIYFNDLKYISACSAILILFNILLNKGLIKNLKKLKLFIIFYATTFVFQFLMNQEGKVLFKIWKIYITEEGLQGFSVNFLRVLNLLMLSWIVTEKKLFVSGMGKYQKIIEDVISLVPEVFTAFKRRMKIKWFFRYMLKQIKLKA